MNRFPVSQQPAGIDFAEFTTRLEAAPFEHHGYAVAFLIGFCQIPMSPAETLVATLPVGAGHW
jgi:hypothetical protein